MTGAATATPPPLLLPGLPRAWGLNDSGQLGDGSQTRRFAPVAVSGLDQVSAVRTGPDRQLYVLDRSGTVSRLVAG